MEPRATMMRAAGAVSAILCALRAAAPAPWPLERLPVTSGGARGPTVSLAAFGGAAVKVALHTDLPLSYIKSGLASALKL